MSVVCRLFAWWLAWDAFRRRNNRVAPVAASFRRNDRWVEAMLTREDMAQILDSFMAERLVSGGKA